MRPRQPRAHGGPRRHGVERAGGLLLLAVSLLARLAPTAVLPVEPLCPQGSRSWAHRLGQLAPGARRLERHACHGRASPPSCWARITACMSSMYLRGGRRMRPDAGAAVRHKKKRKEVVPPLHRAAFPARVIRQSAQDNVCVHESRLLVLIVLAHCLLAHIRLPRPSRVASKHDARKRNA
jgi:hypothetical protein